MSTLKFADTHNMVAFISKPTESEEFEQIAKTVNREVQLQSLVDRKKIIVIGASVKSDLQLDDEEGTDCLPNAIIFEELTRMGAKTTAWNEFSSTMAFVIICLATNQKFNFSKYSFESMVKNSDNERKFLMYPRNMKRVGKGFSGRDTSLFPTMVVQNQEEIVEAVYKELDDSLVRAATTASSLEAEQDSGLGMYLKLLMIHCSQEETKTTQAAEIVSLKKRVKKLEKGKKSRTHKLKRLYKVGLTARVDSSDEEESLGEEDASKQGRKIDDLDADIDVTLVNDAMNDEDIFGVNDLEGDEVIIETEVASKDVNLSVDEVTLAQALATLKSAKPKADKDKSKGKMVEPEPVKKLSKKDQLILDEELAFKLQV
ncbi:hypothetical protein Tco_1451741 [Tanacetum coccineum]